MGEQPRLADTREYRTARLRDVTFRADPKGEIRVRGYASVFSSFSLDLGGFRERVLPGAFDRALSQAPKVLLLWDHDTRRVLASTQNGSLRLETDAVGLRFDAYVLPFSYAQDLTMAMESGLINEASFAFTVERDDWSVGDDAVPVRRVLEVGDLYDVTITARGAYPQTSSQLARSASASPHLSRTERLRVLQAHASSRLQREKYLCARFLDKAAAYDKARAEALSKLAREEVRWVLNNPEQVRPGELERAHRMVAVYRGTDELDRRIRDDRVAAVRRTVAQVDRLWDEVYDR